MKYINNQTPFCNSVAFSSSLLMMKENIILRVLVKGALMVSIGVLTVGCSAVQQKGNGDLTGSVDEQSIENKSLSLVTTIPSLYAHVSNLIDANDIVTHLVEPGTSVHYWQPTPQDVIAMQEADIIFINGLELEAFLDGYLQDLEKKGVLIVDTSVGITLIESDHEHNDHHDDDLYEEGEHHDEDNHVEEGNNDEHKDNKHDGVDPHIWLSPANALIQIQTIRDALIQVDPTQEEYYKKSYEQYRTKIEELDNDIQSMINDATIQPFIVFHDAYQYFLQAYAIDDYQVSMVKDFHGDTPSQRDMADLLKVINENNVSILYTEPQFSTNTVDAIQAETNVRVQQIDPLGSLLSTEGYETLLRELALAFSQKTKE